MNALFSTLFTIQVLLSALLGFSIVATLLQLAPGAALNRRELAAAGALFAFTGGTAWLSWDLKEAGFLPGALLTLFGFWMLVVLGVAVSAARARWN